MRWVRSSKVLNRSFVTKDYLEVTEGLGVVKAVYMEVAAPPSHHVAEAEYVLKLCKRPDAPTCAAVIGGRPGSEEFRDYITRFKGNPYIKGVRQGLSGDTWLTPRFVASIRLLGELGMSFDLCPPAPYLPECLKLVERCPDTRSAAQMPSVPNR